MPCVQSTLMRAIANGKVDGFPPKEQLRTVYVEHDIDASGELFVQRLSKVSEQTRVLGVQLSCARWASCTASQGRGERLLCVAF